jgi:FAD/FMN-containing dehydrogenase
LEATEAVAATAEQDVDLWWALRGGGGGNFGVVTSMTLRLRQPRTPQLLAGSVCWRLSAAASVVVAYNEWIATLPRTMAAYLLVGVKFGYTFPVFCVSRWSTVDLSSM